MDVEGRIPGAISECGLAEEQPQPSVADGLRKAAIFLDKDGTLLVDVPHNVSRSRMRFAPTVSLGLRLLAEFDVPLIVVSNQPGIATGAIEHGQLEDVGRKLHEMFEDVGAVLTAFVWCPHAPDMDGRPACRCRKPNPGLLTAAAAQFGIDLARSWMVGDILNDVEAGSRVGCQTVLINNNNETEWHLGGFRTPDYVVPTFGAGARIIADAFAEALG